MAKPFTEVESDLPAVGSQPQSAVLIIDDTLSMLRETGGEQLITRAKTKARQLVGLMGGQADLALLRVSRPGSPLPKLTRHTRKVLAAIGAVKGRHVHATADEALDWAGRLLADLSQQERHVFLISDMAAHGLRRAGKLKLPPGVQLHQIDVSGEEAVNHAVAALRAAPSTAPGQRSMEITAKICNHSAAADNPMVTLEIDGKEVARGRIKLAPWSCGNKSFSHTFDRGGMHNAAVMLPPDQLRADDRRFLRLEVESALRALLVNGAPSPVRHRDELFYLETALEEVGPGGQVILAKAINSGELKQTRLKVFDVVVLCNVRAVEGEAAASLESFVRRGGGLLVAVGSNVEPAAYNSALGAVLPAGLRGALLAAPPGPAPRRCASAASTARTR